MDYRTPTVRPSLYDHLHSRALHRARRAWLARRAIAAAVGVGFAMVVWLLLGLMFGLFHAAIGVDGLYHLFDPRQVALVTLSSAPFAPVVAFAVSRALRGPFARAVARETRASCEGVAEHEIEELATSAAALA